MSNNGPTNIGATFTLTLPDSFFITKVDPLHGPCSPHVVRNTVRCDFASVPLLSDDGVDIFSYALMIEGIAPDSPGTYVTTATVEAVGGTDPEPANNRAEETTTVK